MPTCAALFTSRIVGKWEGANLIGSTGEIFCLFVHYLNIHTYLSPRCTLYGPACANVKLAHLKEASSTVEQRPTVTMNILKCRTIRVMSSCHFG